MLSKYVCPLFLKHCEMERRLSANTIAAYRQDLKEFSLRYGEISIVAVSGEDLVSYASYLREERKLSPATIKRRLACLKGLFVWLLRKGSVPVNPFQSIDVRIRIPDRLPRCLDPSEAKLLLRAAAASPATTRLAVRLLLTTGCRVGELAALRIGDIDLAEGVIRIVGKGDRERRVFLVNEQVVQDLRVYIETRRSGACREASLFVTNLGERSSTASIRSRVKGLAHHAGVKRHVTPHMLRHTAATMLMESGVDIRFVQKLLGHRSIMTTQIYTHVSDRALKEAITRADICSKMAA